MSESDKKVKEVWAQIKAVSETKKIVGGSSKSVPEVIEKPEETPQRDEGFAEVLERGLLS